MSNTWWACNKCRLRFQSVLLEREDYRVVLAVTEENALHHVLKQRRASEHSTTNGAAHRVRLGGFHATLIYLAELYRDPLIRFRQSQHS